MRVSCQLLFPALLVLCACTATARAGAEEQEWRWRLTPYLWAPSAEGTLKLDGIGGGSEDDGGSALDKLIGGALLSVEARRGSWSVVGDVIWAQFTQQGTLDSPSAAPFEAQSDELVIGLGVARALTNHDGLQLDGVVGLRYFHADLSLETRGGSGVDLSARADLLDPFLGLRARVGGESGPFVLTYGDVGGFGVSSDLTWQALLGAGWAWSWGDVRLGWRAIAYDFDSGGILYDLTARGPFAGVSFAF